MEILINFMVDQQQAFPSKVFAKEMAQVLPSGSQLALS